MDLVGYIRVSSAGQEDGTSLEQQSRAIEQWCESQGHTLRAIFSDAFSGEKILGRTGFKAAIQYSTQNTDGLVVANFDRYSRSSFDSEAVSRLFKAKGKKLISVAQNFDLEDKYGRFTFRVNQAVAELVREQIKERCHSNRMLKAEKGGWIGHRPEYGTRAVQGEKVEDPQEQWVIRYIWRLYTWTRLTQVEIVDLLNHRVDSGDERFLTKHSKPTIRARRRAYRKEFTYRWTQGIVSKILRRVAEQKGDGQWISKQNRTRVLKRSKAC
jgi:DNA invertase Pin-like site-specific DNA recombinase